LAIFQFNEMQLMAQVQAMKDGLAKLKEQGIEAIED
jgi:hypothetical protein